MELKRTDRGFSVVEVLIASLIFVIIAIGILPLFAASTKNNLDGREATETANFGRSAVEDLLQAPFNDPRLVVPAAGTVSTVQEYYSKKDQVWKAGTGTGLDSGLWRRQIRVRQFNINDLADNGIFDDPKRGDEDLGQVHIKEVEVQVWNSRDDKAVLEGGRRLTTLGMSRRFTVRMLKSM
ncbi:MAG TPA: prepilin-type N-terminal cleavage/methylation domain-containing protein [Thermoanaerobaculia bacterium]|nr:prepilin-type N-terminal cleavage/methylation domain-containing protein [Thermoanaerobaculia bacterium]